MLELIGAHEVAHATKQNFKIADHQDQEKDATKQGMGIMKDGKSIGRYQIEDCPTCKEK
jgi:hypothetical protein